ncbi:three-helix bundle dimerization domain-containing protein [Rhodococcus koreensis]|uniref:three-helix bundle dimerization domain-containing protein n=1 Tax=Rhodococcus koreensis TaxID=99653 RepID=UPI000AD4BEC8
MGDSEEHAIDVVRTRLIQRYPHLDPEVIEDLIEASFTPRTAPAVRAAIGGWGCGGSSRVTHHVCREERARPGSGGTGVGGRPPRPGGVSLMLRQDRGG